MLHLLVGFNTVCVQRETDRDRVKQRDLGQLCSILILAVECDVDGAVILT